MAPALDIRATQQDPPTPPNGLDSVTASLKKAKLDNIVDYQDFHYASNVTAESTYPHAALLPTFPDDAQPPLDGLTPVDDRGAYSKARGGWEAGPLAKRAHIEHVVPNIGSEITGIDLRTLSNAEKDDLALLVAERGVVVVRDQHDMTMHDQLDLGRYYGHLHRHATTGVPADPAYKDVHVVFTDAKKRPPATAFSKLQLVHSDVTYELQPPGITMLRILDMPKYGGDTVFASQAALYDSLSPAMQKYLESLSVVHSAVEQAEGNRRAGQPVRREPIETIHPLVRVHPVTGWKSIFYNPGFARYIVGVPKAESEAILSFLATYSSQSEENKMRARWQPGTVVLWDNRGLVHLATYDIYPHRRHAVRVTVTAERPISVADAESRGVKPVSREAEIYSRLGIDEFAEASNKLGDASKAKGYAD